MRAARHIQRRGRGGFTVLEVVLAMGILVMGMTVILSLLTFGAALTRTAAMRTSAATSAEAVVADLEETLFPLEEDGSVGEPQKIEKRPVDSAPGLFYSAEAFVNPGNELEYRVDVEMFWEAQGERRSKRFTTLLLREIPFGERMRREFIDRRSRRGP